MSYALPLTNPFYRGAGTSGEVPGKYDCAFNGLGFMYDTRYFSGQGQARFGGSGKQLRSSIQLLKPQQDNSGEISERSLNPEDLIRQSQEMWHHGAGQVFFDRADSDSARFRSSKGIDVFSEKFKFQLLPDTAKKSSSANTVMAFAVAGSRFYRIDGTTVEYTTDITADTPAWTAVTGLPAGAPVSICSDGLNVYIACTANGIYKTDTTTNAAASWVTGTVTLVAWVKGRLMVAGGGHIYNVTVGGGPTALPAALDSSLNTGITWVGFAEGPAHIYATGYTGTKSLVYKITIAADGAALAAPSVACSLPDGETVSSLYGYEGYVFVGTAKGAWIAKPDVNGNLTKNKVLTTSSAVQCFEGQDRFVWFGYTNYDTGSTGLGRMDLGSDIGTREVITPAYATDLMTTYGTTTQGAVLAVATFQGIRVFAVSGAGFWAEGTLKVPSATLRTGLITYDLADNKIAIWLTLGHEALVGTIAAGIAANGSTTFTTIGSSTSDGAVAVTIPASETSGQTFEIEFTVTRSTSATTTGPKGTRWVLESNPAPGRGEFFAVGLRFYREIETRVGDEALDVYAAYQALVQMEERGLPVTFQDAWGIETVFIDDHDFLTDEYDQHGHQGTFVARVRRPRRRST